MKTILVCIFIISLLSMVHGARQNWYGSTEWSEIIACWKRKAINCPGFLFSSCCTKYKYCVHGVHTTCKYGQYSN